MNEVITKENLDMVIKLNFKIEDDTNYCIKEIYRRYNSSQINSPEKLAYKILNDYSLIQIPIKDPYLGGKVEVRKGHKIPIINTAQPRIYQYFIAWHEIYHLLFDERLNKETIRNDIEVLDLSDIERRANYFAASILLGNVSDYYSSIKGTFIEKVYRCMDAYKAPYKVILVKLYQDAYKVNNEEMKEMCLRYLEEKPDDFVKVFEELGLDSGLVKPSYVINFSSLESKILEQKEENPDISYHECNFEYLKKLRNQLMHLRD